VFFRQQFVKSTNYLNNTEANKLVMPEVGTYAEPENISTDEFGEPYRTGKIRRQRRKFLLEEGLSTDNTVVNVIQIAGYLMSLTDSCFRHLHDPETLETLHRIDINSSPNIPEGIFCMTTSSHPILDHETGDLWDVAGCLDFFENEYNIPQPHIYPVVWRGVGLPRSSYSTPWTQERILEAIEFGPLIASPPVPEHISAMPYFHSIASAGKYLILPVGGTVLDLMPMLKSNFTASLTRFISNFLDAIRQKEPMINQLKFVDTAPARFLIFDRESMSWESVQPMAQAFSHFHVINSFINSIGQISIDIIEGTVIPQIFYNNFLSKSKCDGRTCD
jgi:carotenoid cleavage dioxygenase-like enzyme